MLYHKIDMALPSYTISTSILNVDCSGSGKIVFLPPANTIQGVSFWIRDGTGRCSEASSIYISTQGSDLMDQYASTLRLSTAYQSVRCVAWQPTSYAILQNYTSGLSPFLARFTENIGWNPRESTRSWTGAASSSSGTTLVSCVGGGGGQIYVSTNSGTTWTAYGPTLVWSGVASSSNGTKLVAISSGDRIYISTNTGISWTPRASIKPWTCVCSSADGVTLLAGTFNDFLFVSVDSGASWTQTNVVANYTGVACSSDGSIMYAVASGDTIYQSSDTGITWTQQDSVRNWAGVACTADGITAFATDSTSIYKTTDLGTTWTPSTFLGTAWGSITCSSSGAIVVTVDVVAGRIYFSGNYGFSYSVSGDPSPYTALACNSNGNVILAASNPGTLYLGALQLL